MRFAFSLIVVFLLAGCYYQIQDPRTGQLYYTDRWVAADGYAGPLTFTDHTGRTVSLSASRVSRIGRQEYLEATTPPVAEANESAAPAESQER